jgi:hypothetical protein
MNQQIEQLALQAGFNLHNDIIDGHDFKHEIEKFAQSIVHEMLQTCEEHPGWYGRDIGEQIKQRFGVKS